MQYLLNEKQKEFLLESHKLLNDVEVKGGKNLSALVGAMVRLEEVIKNLIEKPNDVPKEE